MSGFAKYLPTSSPSSKFYLRVHELATDSFNDCSSTGALDKENLAGDLARLEIDQDGFAWYDTTSSQISLYGKNGAIGRSVVLYEASGDA